MASRRSACASGGVLAAAQPQNALDFDGADDQVVVAGASTFLVDGVQHIALLVGARPRRR